MRFAEKLKKARKEYGMSQEVLADKLGVSRQAVTKWETDKGLPDIENMLIISKLFGISLDELLTDEKESHIRTRFLYESKTEYDIDGNKKFDLKLGSADSLVITGTDDEKIVVLLGSNDIVNLRENYKVKIDDIKRRIDVEINHVNSTVETESHENLTIEVLFPNRYLDHIEIECDCNNLEINNLVCENVEHNGTVRKCLVKSLEGVFELDSNANMDIAINKMKGSFELNQVVASSRITVPSDLSFQTRLKGVKTSIKYEKAGLKTEDFSVDDSENVIEFNGIKSELVIATED